MNRTPYKLAVLASHPIQYQAPLFRVLAQRPAIDLHVFYCRRIGWERYQDPGFGVTFSWDIPLLEGYKHTFLCNISPYVNSSRFFGVVNPGIVAAIWRGKFDAIWINGWALATNWIAWAGASALHVPILLRSETNGLAEPRGLRRGVKRMVLQTFFSRVAGFLAIGTHNENYYKSYGVPQERIFLTPYCVDNAFFMERARELAGQKRDLREKEGIPPDLPIILFCGKFQEKKRPLDLLRAFSLLNGQPPAALVFVGDGALRPAMERFVAQHSLPHVYFLGFKNQKEIATYYAMADVLVLPSSDETWGLVLNEAMCCGLPVVASDKVGAAADLVREGVNGFIYPVGNVSALADRLQRVLADEQTRKEMGRQSREIISRWGIKEDIEGVLKALQVVVRKRIPLCRTHLLSCF